MDGWLQAVSIRSWWVWGFGLLCFTLFELAVEYDRREVQLLETELQQQQQRLTLLQKREEELHLQLASRDDPAWIELKLMQELGVVPEGSQKVYFRP